MSRPHPLDPPLPFAMKPAADRAAADVQLRQFVDAATHAKDRGRVAACADAFGDRYHDVRQLAGRIKQHTLDHLDTYLEQFVDRATDAGVQVHFARDGAQANDICLDIAQTRGCRRCVKSKSMVTEETCLVPALEAAGITTVETDLGEFIIQLDDDAPSHIVTPMIHKDRRSVARAFQRELDAPYTEDPEQLTMIAREHMRRRYREADLGITGANFLIADTGSVVVCTNEGNADFTMHGPETHVIFAGIEKVIPRTEHLSIFLKLLARSATAQSMTVYTSVVTGPRRGGEHDGPREVHLVLIDNGRTEILRAETRELLRCIRCGACLNACPVYRNVGGGHAYGAVYSGPIGAVITPLFKGLENYPDLPHASSLCGACEAACPVAIDIPHHLVRLRREMVTKRVTGLRARLAYRLWAKCLRHRWSYSLASAAQRTILRALARPSPGDDRRWIGPTSGGGPLAGWTSRRDFPAPPAQGFRDWWTRHERGEGD